MASFYGVTLHILQIFSGYKKKIQLLRVLGIRDSCRELFKTLNILPHQSQYIFLLHFAVMNMDQYKVNLDIQGKDTRHQTPSNLSLYPSGTYYMGIKISNSLPFYTKDVSHNIKLFKLVLRNFLYSNTF